MRPTRYPTWRSLAFAIAIVEFLSLAVLVSRSGLNSPRLHPHDPSIQEISIFSQLVTMIGALLITRRPAGGFMLFGAGFLLLAGFMIALLPWERPLLVPVTALILPGLLYVVLGVKQRSADRTPV